MSSDISVDDFLAHYGVKGMKWGVRKDRSSSRQASKSAKQALEESANRSAARTDRGLTRADYKKLSTDSVRIERGTKLNRITNNPDFESKSGLIYASHKPEDVARYKSMIPQFLKEVYGRRAAKNIYDVEYTAVKTLVSPSEKVRVDTFLELMDKPISELRMVTGKKRVMTGRDHVAWLGEVALTNKEFKALSNVDLGLKAYLNFVKEQPIKSELNTAYFNSLRAKGYNMILDDLDRGDLASSPVAIINAAGAVTKTNVTKLSKSEIQYALKNTPKFASEERTKP